MRNECKDCHNTRQRSYKKAECPTKKKKRTLWDRYKLTLEELEHMETEQQGKCKICNSSDVKRLVIDHCHNTGKVRGLLCDRCYTGLGFLEQHNFDLFKFEECCRSTIVPVFRQTEGGF